MHRCRTLFRTIALLGVCAVANPAAQADAPAGRGDVACLWSSLSPTTQLRLELSVQTRGAFSLDEIAAFGDARLASLLAHCGFAPTAESVNVMARYWAVKAALPTHRAAVTDAGVDIAAADAALAVAAPLTDRARLADEIAGRPGGVSPSDGPAAQAVRAAIAELDAEIGPVSPDAARSLIEYFAATILADGLASSP